MITIRELKADLQRIVNEVRTVDELSSIKERIKIYFPDELDEMISTKEAEIRAMAKIRAHNANKGHRTRLEKQKWIDSL